MVDSRDQVIEFLNNASTSEMDSMLSDLSVADLVKIQNSNDLDEITRQFVEEEIAKRISQNPVPYEEETTDKNSNTKKPKSSKKIDHSIFWDKIVSPIRNPNPVKIKNNFYYYGFITAPDETEKIALTIGSICYSWSYNFPIIILGFSSTTSEEKKKWKACIRPLTSEEKKKYPIIFSHPNNKASARISKSQKLPVKIDLDSIIFILDKKKEIIADQFEEMAHYCHSKIPPRSKSSRIEQIRELEKKREENDQKNDQYQEIYPDQEFVCIYLLIIKLFFFFFLVLLTY